MNANTGDFGDVGRSLVEQSRKADFTAQRGVVGELFPYIYQASKRMSTRAICEFLKKAHGIKLSPVTIAKALRNEGKHWQKFFGLLAPAASYVGGVNAVEPENLLSRPTHDFEVLVDGDPLAPKDIVDMAEYKVCVQELREKWFSLDQEIRDRGLMYASAHYFKKESKRGEKKAR